MKVLYKFSLFLFCSVLFAESVSMGGFIRFDSFYNSRQIVSAREGHFYLYPLKPSYDENEKDKNRFPLYNMTSFQTRVWMKTQQKDFGAYSVSGKIEVDFFGTYNYLSNTLRLRHSFIQLENSSRKIIIGQYWSPMFTPDVYPSVINFNTGAPFHPFARFPQISLYQKIGWGIEIRTSASMQRDAYSEIMGNYYQQLAGVPAFHLHTLYKNKSIILGGGFTQKSIRPIEEVMQLSAFTLYGKASYSGLTIKAKWILGEDLTDHLMIGGLVKSTDSDISNVYGTTITSSWIDFNFSKSHISTGLFFGFAENHGVDPEYESEQLSLLAMRGSDILDLWRISPRVSISRNNLKFGIEYDYTEMRYNEHLDENFIPISDLLNTSSNHRLLFITMLSF